MEKTKNYKLLKPGVDDFYDVRDFNKNADIVDQELKRVTESVGEAVEEIRGEIADIDLGEIGEALDQKVDIKTMQAVLDGKEPLIRNVEERLSLLNADTIPISDSLASKATKKITFANLKESLKTVFDSYYNKYVHPTYTARSAGLYKTTVDSTGHVSAVTAVQKADITVLGIPGREQVPNKNLLLNWDFRNPVNQRGQSSYLPGRYSVDRWIISAGKLDVVSGGIRLTYTNGALLYQSIEKHEMEQLAGKNLTLSLQKTDGTIISGTVTLPTVIPRDVNYYRAYQASNMLMEVVVGSDSNTYHLFRLSISEGSTINIARVKLELGPVSTLANDPSANYGEQLALCQRYYQRFKAQGTYDLFARGTFSNAREFVVTIGFGISMRKVPTISYAGNVVATTWEGAIEKITSVRYLCFVGNALTFATIVDTDMLMGASGILRANNDPNAYIEFDAEIY